MKCTLFGLGWWFFRRCWNTSLTLHNQWIERRFSKHADLIYFLLVSLSHNYHNRLSAMSQSISFLWMRGGASTLDFCAGTQPKTPSSQIVRNLTTPFKTVYFNNNNNRMCCPQKEGAVLVLTRPSSLETVWWRVLSGCNRYIDFQVLVLPLQRKSVKTQFMVSSKEEGIVGRLLGTAQQGKKQMPAEVLQESNFFCTYFVWKSKY